MRRHATIKFRISSSTYRAKTNEKESMPMPFNKEHFNRDWFILRSLVTKDFKLKYRRSVLGVLWSVLNPLLMMVVLTAVFSTVFRFNIENFPLYLILGQTLFTFMSDATSAAMSSIIDSAPLIKKIRINKVLFPLEKVCFALVNFVVSLIAVAAVMLFFRIVPTVNLLLLPFLLAMLFMFSLGIGLLLAALSVFFRDVMHLWSVLLTAWTYATPLFYPVDILPDWAVPIMNANPMYYYVSYFREIALYGTTPTLEQTLVCLLCGVGALIVGLLVFKKQEKKFILYV